VKEGAANPLAFFRGKPQASVNPDGHGARTTPVDAYQGRGDSPFGVVDMAGNVWEWCTTDYNTSNNDITNKLKARVLRGGAWYYYDATGFRADYRNRSVPQVGYDFGGFSRGPLLTLPFWDAERPSGNEFPAWGQKSVETDCQPRAHADFQSSSDDFQRQPGHSLPGEAGALDNTPLNPDTRYRCVYCVCLL
jgi:hypothetical protein